MRVVIADDSVLLREGLAKILADGGFDVVGQARNADELLLKVRSYNPDVAVVDVRMPGGGPELVGRLITIDPTLIVVALSAERSDRVRETMLAAGASAYLVKGDAALDLVATVRTLVARQ